MLSMYLMTSSSEMRMVTGQVSFTVTEVFYESSHTCRLTWYQQSTLTSCLETLSNKKSER